MKNLILICLLNIIIVPSAFAQREYSNWYFGDHSGVTFNTADNEPVSLSGNNSKQFEGCATISDKNGNLLLYSTESTSSTNSERFSISEISYTDISLLHNQL